MNRRFFIAGLAGVAVSTPAASQGEVPLRGALDAGAFEIRPDARCDQSAAFIRLLRQAAGRNAPVFLPAGDYVLSGIDLPDRIRIVGVAGATRLIQGGGSLFRAQDASLIHLEGLTFDGAGRRLDDDARALVEIRRAANVVIDRCEIINSSKSGLVLERMSGRVERTTISRAADYALYAVQSDGLRIVGNTVTDCANGGILVHRWEPGPDGTMVTGNRVARIGARSGGTGQYGNGINIFRAETVTVSDNHVADCAFSAIRANSASNVMISGNQCLRSGETAIYAEFAFEGAVINGNVVDGAAIGISIANLNDGGRMAVCNGNIVRNLVDQAPYKAFEAMGFGVGIAAEAETAITGNVIEGAPRCGVLLGWGPYLRNIVATGNMIRDSREGFAVSVVEGVGPVLIADNVISGAQRAVAGYRWRERATDDLAAEVANGFATLRIERNLVS